MPRKTTTEAAATTKPAAKKTATRRTKKATEPIVLSWEHIAERAYYIHLDEGGNEVDNWLRAEQELIAA
jgi:Protein of unknown function (DUF2934)